MNIKSTYSSGILIAILVLTTTLNADYIDDMQRSTVNSQRRKALIEAKSDNCNHALKLINKSTNLRQEQKVSPTAIKGHDCRIILSEPTGIHDLNWYISYKDCYVQTHIKGQ